MSAFVKVEVNGAVSGGALLGVCPTSRGQSPAHQRGSASSTTSSKQRRYSEQGRRRPAGRCIWMTLSGEPSPSPPAACPSSAALPSRGGQASVQAEAKREVGGQSKKSDAAETGSPPLGNANNPNMPDVLGRRRVLATPTVSPVAGENRKGGVLFLNDGGYVSLVLYLLRAPPPA